MSTDIASHRLEDIVIQMQSQMITILHIMSGGGTANYEDLLGISEDSRNKGCVCVGGVVSTHINCCAAGKGPVKDFQQGSADYRAIDKGLFY